MTRTLLKPALLALCCVVALSASAQAPADSAGILATVDGTAISEARFNASYVDHLIRTGRNDTPDERRRHLDNLIDTYLLAGEARRQGLGGAEFERFVAHATDRAVGGAWFESAFRDSVAQPSEALVRQAYLRGREELLVRHLFFSSEEYARAAADRLQRGERFVDLANELYGTAAFDSTAGLLGRIGYWDADDTFAEAAFSLPVGGVSAPVRTRYGWHLIKVEDRFPDPLPTEADYLARRKGVSGKLRARRVRLEGDSFVRSLMDGLQVHPDAEGMALLQASVGRAFGAKEDPQESARTGLKSEEIAAIQAELTPATPLLRYVMEGQPRLFTAGDWAEWLEDLPYGEVRHRVGASVGRALRNALLAEKGRAAGLAASEDVREELRFQEAVYLARMARQALRRDEAPPPTEAQMQEAFDRLGYRHLKDAVGDYWTIPYANVALAEEARDRLQSGALRPEEEPGYRAMSGAPLMGRDPLRRAAREAPLRLPVVVEVADRPLLLYVSERSLTFTTLGDVRPQIEALLRTSLPEVDLLRRLRAKSRIAVDEGLFEHMMNR